MEPDRTLSVTHHSAACFCRIPDLPRMYRSCIGDGVRLGCVRGQGHLQPSPRVLLAAQRQQRSSIVALNPHRLGMNPVRGTASNAGHQSALSTPLSGEVLNRPPVRQLLLSGGSHRPCLPGFGSCGLGGGSCT